MTARYALVTPAHNEADHLPRLVESIARQSNRPVRWVIVSDSSTDTTDEIGVRAAAKYSFITFARHDGGADRDFARKVAAVEHGMGLVDSEVDFIGITDADVEFAPHYFDELIAEFNAEELLGLAGGLVVDVDGDGVEHGRPGRPDMVPGAVQLFRTACWDDVGGYPSMRFGSEDTVACLTAQMHGWTTRVVDRLVVRHHRESGTADRSLLRVRYREGRRDHATGYHPAFAVAKGVRRLPQRPLVIGAAARLVGFTVGSIRRDPIEVDSIVVEYLRDKQLREMKIRR